VFSGQERNEYQVGSVFAGVFGRIYRGVSRGLAELQSLTIIANDPSENLNTRAVFLETQSPGR
jgi:hypothetical protein